MATLNVSRIALAVSTLLVLCLPVLTQADVAKFVSSEGQAYLEVKTDTGVQKIYTEYHGDYKALLVFGEKDNPELLEFSFVDGSKKIGTFVVEFRTEKDVPPAGAQVATNEFIKSLSSDAKGFAEWQTLFASLPEEPTGRIVVADAALADPIGIAIVDENDTLVFRIRDWLCHCRDGRVTGLCFVSAVRCVFDNLCTVWDCMERGDWTPECESALQYAQACMNELEE